MGIIADLCNTCGDRLNVPWREVLVIDGVRYCNECGEKVRRELYDRKRDAERLVAIEQAKVLARRLDQSIYMSYVCSASGHMNVYRRYAFFLEHSPWFSCEMITPDGEVHGREEYT